MTEHGAYRLLLDAYYSAGQPLPADKEGLYRAAKAMSALERKAVDKVAAMFFPVGADGLRHNERADQEVEKYDTQAGTNKRIAEEREAKRRAERNEHEPSTNRATDGETNDSTQTPPTRSQKSEESKSKALSGKPDAAIRILDHLNATCGTKYQPVASTLSLLTARLSEYSEDDLRRVVDAKYAEWKGTDMEQYLRPATLFNATKCAQYAGQPAPVQSHKGTW